MREDKEPIDYLFVGVSFFANVEAVQWFINNVMPMVDGHFHVVGKGMNKALFHNVTNRVHIHGYVDDLSDYYYRARWGLKRRLRGMKWMRDVCCYVKEQRTM